MNNDLISREALIKAVEDLYEYAELGEVLGVIKEAPTVTPTFQLKDITDEDVARFAMIWQRATSKGLILEPERPQGEWIDYSDIDGFIECPFCHKATTCEDNIDELHYCWNCGAKLGKGGADMREDSEK